MTYETILYDVQDGVATITLNQPDTYNALTQKSYKEILHALKQVNRDENARVLVLTGAGKGFCSGANLTEFDITQQSIEVGDVLRAGLNQISMALRNLPKPVICAINGVAAGAGASLTLSCDYRIASDKASYVFGAFLNIGIIPDAGATYLLPQLIGASRAIELAWLADGENRLDMQTACNYGLVQRVVAQDDFESDVAALAAKMAGMATKALAMSKRAIYSASERTLPEALEYEAQLQTAAFRTDDFKEGVMAFLEKRPPEFKGK
ncbi:MAG: enoyl-CoA hydratase/isomerase family protein [Aggregatilineales bacterium]